MVVTLKDVPGFYISLRANQSRALQKHRTGQSAAGELAQATQAQGYDQDAFKNERVHWSYPPPVVGVFQVGGLSGEGVLTSARSVLAVQPEPLVRISNKGRTMTTNLESQADQIVTLSKEIDRTETELQYCAGIIASMASDGETDSPIFKSQVLRYRQLRDSLKAAGQAYWDALNA